MRRILLVSVAAVALTVQVANAGGVVEPVMTVEAVTPQRASNGGLIIPLLLLLVLLAAASNAGGSPVPVD